MKELVNRWRSKPSQLGKFLIRWVAFGLALLTAIGGSIEYLSLVPADWIPEWIKETVPVAGFISFVAGKMTKHPDNDNDRRQGEDDDQST